MSPLATLHLGSPTTNAPTTRVQGIWVAVAPLLYLGCWVVLWNAAYVNPGVLPRRWQLPPPEQQTTEDRELCNEGGQVC
jgi:hypothetical protein